MVFVNKVVLNSTPNLPFSLLLVQTFICIALLHVCKWITQTPGFSSYLPFHAELPEIDLRGFYTLAPVSLIGIAGIIFNTLCLKDVDASFFQIARGLILPLTVVVSAIATRTMPRYKVLRAAFVVTGGFFIGATPSSYFSRHTTALDVTARSLVYGILSSLMTALHAVMVKSAQQYMGGNNVIGMAYWTNLIAICALPPFVILNEEVGAVLALNGEEMKVFVIGCAVTGFFGFLLCMAGLLSIKVTSPVTHMFSSAARSVIQSVLGVVIFGDVITPNRASSIFVITAGTVYYTWLKSSTPPPPPPPPSTDHDVEKGTDEGAQKI
ncbi:uncharacterized protein EI90DRAFT_2928772 [Cantharellus anzutake]|uniref:uncharacterized protein n=1 Tax=Cantharellus anzutake TaxID=1750568 RepID=UPI001902F463|nr:uncharacterized protein EI90DRAFT_2928772 [Cantharellus anzutake]KAF8327288.1 hypothetical protein EI90DRAFT_2928772 [Cantharellus anzutake]